VPTDASDEEIARAFRLLAKQLHPDVGPQRPEQSARFTSVVAAYDVLSQPTQRYDYDDVRASALAARAARERVAVASATATPGASARAPMVNWTPRKAAATVGAGVICTLLGIAFSIFIFSMQAGERADRAGRVHVHATAFVDSNSTRHLTFRTTDGDQVTIPQPTRLNPGVLQTGDTLTLLYRPSHPTDVIVDETHFGRDFTYWFIAVKLIVCGPVIAALGIRKRRWLRRRAARGDGLALGPPPARVAIPA